MTFNPRPLAEEIDMATNYGSVVAPPGTRRAPAQNLGPTERVISAVAGTVLGLAAAKRGGIAGVALGMAPSAPVARGATGAAPIKRLAGQNLDERAAAERSGWDAAAVVSRAVTINATRQQLYDRFRDFSQLPSFMENVDSITVTDPTHSHWVVKAPGGMTVEWDAIITVDRPGELISWKAAPGASIDNHGTVEFRDAPLHRGTEVHLTVIYRPPGGAIGRLAAKLTQLEPGIQARRDLKRFKMLVEAGEVATNLPQGTHPKA